MKDQEKEAKEEIIPVEAIEVETEHVEAEKFSLTKFVSTEDLNKALASAENAFLYLDKMREFVMKRTKPNDFTNQSGNPYFGEAGCNRFMAPFKIYEKGVVAWTIDANGQKREMKDKNVFDENTRIIFFSGIIGSELLGVEASFEGGSRLDDTFRSKDDILFYFQKAKANWRGRGFRKLLGMENLTWGDLAKVGIKPEDVKAIDRVTTEKADSKDTQDLWNMILELNGGDVKAGEDYLQKMTAFKDYAGQRKVSRLSQKQYNIVHGKVRDEYHNKFPGKASHTTEEKTEKTSPAPQGEDAFAKSVNALREKVGEADFKQLLSDFNVSDAYEISNGGRNKFLIALNKLAKKGE